MPNFPQRDVYSPTAESLKYYAESKKKELQITTDFVLPGLNVSVDHDKHKFWFGVAMFGEVLGFILTVWGGLSYGDPAIGIGAIIVVFLFIVADWFIARLRISANNGIICLSENKKFINTPTNGDALKIKTIEDCNNAIKSAKFNNNVMAFLLYFMAALKTFALFFVGSVFGSSLFAIAMGIYFIIIAYIHSAITPYYFGYTKTKDAFDADFHAKHSLAHRKKSQPFTLRKLENGNGYEKNIANAVFLAKSGGNEEYQVETTGIIYDQDISILVGGLIPEDQKKVARACHEIQLM